MQPKAKKFLTASLYLALMLVLAGCHEEKKIAPPAIQVTVVKMETEHFHSFCNLSVLLKAPIRLTSLHAFKATWIRSAMWKGAWSKRGSSFPA